MIHFLICFRNTTLSLIASTHWTVQWDFKVILLPERNVITTIPWHSVSATQSQSGPLMVAHHRPTTSGVRQRPWSLHVWKKLITAVVGWNRGWRGNMPRQWQWSDLCVWTHFTSGCLHVITVQCKDSRHSWDFIKAWTDKSIRVQLSLPYLLWIKCCDKQKFGDTILDEK